jgi:hypothetical protein
MGQSCFFVGLLRYNRTPCREKEKEGRIRHLLWKDKLGMQSLRNIELRT